MKVYELIDLLKLQDPNALVVVSGYEDGLDDTVSIVAVPIELNAHPNRYYYGRHKAVTHAKTIKDPVAAVWIKGNRRYPQ